MQTRGSHKRSCTSMDRGRACCYMGHSNTTLIVVVTLGHLGIILHTLTIQLGYNMYCTTPKALLDLQCALPHTTHVRLFADHPSPHASVSRVPSVV